jgi:hypothetical protein
MERRRRRDQKATRAAAMLGRVDARIWRPLRTVDAFGGEDPAVGGPWYHEVMTRAAAAAAGWSSRTAPHDEGRSTPRSEQDRAGEAVAWAADYVDSYLYNPVWWVAGGSDRFHLAVMLHDDLVKLHFDDLTSTPQVRHMWARYEAGTIAACLWAAQREDVAAARNAVGVCLHAMQDFYSHSNWVDDPQRAQRTWYEARGSTDQPDPRRSMELYTGSYEHGTQHGFKDHGRIAISCTVLDKLGLATTMDAMCSAISPFSNTGLCQTWRDCRRGSPPVSPDSLLYVPDNAVYLSPGIALDSRWLARENIRHRDVSDQVRAAGGEALFQKAKNLAIRTSVQWLEQLAQEMADAGHESFWDEVTSQPRQGRYDRLPISTVADAFLSGYQEDLDQFEDPSQLPLGFLTVGDYPPAPGQRDDDKWWLRLELHTSDDLLAGTDADIVAIVDDGTPQEFPLDRMHERTPKGGLNEVRLFEWDDFEAGSGDVYYLGPLRRVPTVLELCNRPASFVDVLSGAWEDVKRAAEGALDLVAGVMLSLIGGHADLVGHAKATFSWRDLVAIVDAGGQHELRLDVDGGQEGHYRVIGLARVTLTPTGAHVTVRFTELRCIRESAWDRGSSSDEPFVLALVSSPAQAQLERMDVIGPFNGVDKGDVRRFNGQLITVTVPRHGGLIVPIQVFESDDEGASGRRRLLDEFESLFGAEIASTRSKFLDALGASIGPDWKLASADAFAFRRSRPVQVAPLLSAKLDRWIEGRDSLVLPLDGSMLPVRYAELVIAEIEHDPPGADIAYGGGEYVRLDNVTTRTIDVGGWSLRDRAGHRLRIPRSYQIAPGRSLYVHTGPGKNTTARCFAGREKAVWNNRGGDTVELLTSDGKLVASSSY